MRLAVILLLAPVLAACAGTSGSTSSGSSSATSSATSKSNDAAQNITVSDCKVDDLGGTRIATIGYTVNNPTPKSSNYLIEIIDSTKAKVGSANGAENNVLPGRPSLGKAIGNVSSSAVAPYTCQVGKTIRLAA